MTGDPLVDDADDYHDLLVEEPPPPVFEPAPEQACATLGSGPDGHPRKLFKVVQPQKWHVHAQFPFVTLDALEQDENAEFNTPVTLHTSLRKDVVTSMLQPGTVLSCRMRSPIPADTAAVVVPNERIAVRATLVAHSVIGKLHWERGAPASGLTEQKLQL